MARVVLTPQKCTPLGLQPTMTAPIVDGDVVPADGRSVLVVTNASASPINVTAQTPAQMSGLDVAENIVVVAAGAVCKLIGPFDAATFARPDGGADPGTVYVNYSALVSVTRGLIKL
jgi:hypothetical protein